MLLYFFQYSLCTFSSWNTEYGGIINNYLDSMALYVLSWIVIVLFI